MDFENSSIKAISKEAIDNLHFPGQDVLHSPEEWAKRRFDAERAMKLGNQFKDKVKIAFEDDDGMKMVETTVWGLTDTMLLLKRGMIIPLYRVHQIII